MDSDKVDIYEELQKSGQYFWHSVIQLTPAEGI